MILIADSGSTKCDWVLLDGKGRIIFKTQTLGLNPNVLTTQKMHKRLAQSEEISHINQVVHEVYFYGAGCGTEKTKIRLKRFLEKYFRRATCEVQEDLLGACLSITKEPGIVGILGTGSNACYFDGSTIETKTPSMGYALMDEGSGNYFGKKLLIDYYYGDMPEAIAENFADDFNLDPEHVKHELYKEENPNSYLSEFAKFIFTFDEMPDYLIKTLKEGLNLFVDKWILPLAKDRDVPIHFVGSLAYHSKDILQDVLQSKGLKLGEIERYPIDSLTRYFQEKLTKKK